MYTLHKPTTPHVLGAGSSPNENVEKANYVDPEGGDEVDPDVMNAIVQYVLSLPPDAEGDDHSVVGTSSAVDTVSSVETLVTPPINQTPISQNPYIAWTAWTRPAASPQALAVAPVTSSNWTGVNSYEGFWSKFSDSQYLMQFAANEPANLRFQDSAALPDANLAPAGSQFPFTGTVAPSEVFGPIQSKIPPPASKPRSKPHACQKSSPLKRELTLRYTVQELIEEFPSLAHVIKVIPVKIEASLVCNRVGCSAKISGDPSAIVKHGKEHLHVNQITKINCIYEKCSSKIAIKDFELHVGSHLKRNGARCGVCRDWFANSDLASDHLTQPCPVLLSRCRAEGYPPPSKKMRLTER